MGYIIRGPLGGLVWHHFQYVYGLHLMGHDVLFLEESEDYPSCYHPRSCEMTTDPAFGLSFTHKLFSHFGMGDHWVYCDWHTRRFYGKSESAVRTFLNQADLLLNISGVNPLTDKVSHIPRKFLIDTDPVFTQIRHLTNPTAQKNAAGHDGFLTFGEHFGKKGCTIPADGFPWYATRQPIIAELWKNGSDVPGGRWTTVMQWESYKNALWDNQSYGMKSRSFLAFADLPQRVKEKMEIALGSVNAPQEELRTKGWHVKDSQRITRTPFSYRQYIRHSKGEWSVAKHGYVATCSGWFSERSAVYLASGKPVILQDTGFSSLLDTGEGLFAFREPEEMNGIFEAVNQDYKRHCTKAVEISREYFDFRKILNRIIA